MTDLGPVINDIVENAGRRAVWQLMGDSFGLDSYRALPDGIYPCEQVDVHVDHGEVFITTVQNIGENRSRDAHG